MLVSQGQFHADRLPLDNVLQPCSKHRLAAVQAWLLEGGRAKQPYSSLTSDS